MQSSLKWREHMKALSELKVWSALLMMCNSFALQSLTASLFALLLLVGTRKKLKCGYLPLSAYVGQSTIQQFAPGISRNNIENNSLRRRGLVKMHTCFATGSQVWLLSRNFEERQHRPLIFAAFLSSLYSIIFDWRYAAKRMQVLRFWRKHWSCSSGLISATYSSKKNFNFNVEL